MDRLVLLAQLWILQLLNYLSFFEEWPKCKNWSCMGATLSHFLGAVLVFFPAGPAAWVPCLTCVGGRYSSLGIFLLSFSLSDHSFSVHPKTVEGTSWGGNGQSPPWGLPLCPPPCGRLLRRGLAHYRPNHPQLSGSGSAEDAEAGWARGLAYKVGVWQLL